MIRVCAEADVPLGEGRALTIGERRLAIFRTASGWYVVDDACPHAGGPLSDGIVGDRTVICPLHERRYALAGGAPLSGGDGVAAHPAEVRGERVFVTLAQIERRAA